MKQKRSVIQRCCKCEIKLGSKNLFVICKQNYSVSICSFLVILPQVSILNKSNLKIFVLIAVPFFESSVICITLLLFDKISNQLAIFFAILAFCVSKCGIYHEKFSQRFQLESGTECYHAVKIPCTQAFRGSNDIGGSFFNDLAPFP